MAKTTIKPARKNKKPKTAAGRWLQDFMKRALCKRSIIVISDHKTQHVPFAASTQAFLAIGIMGFVAWGAFSSGSYMAAQKVIDEKEQKLANFAQENERVEAEFALLKQDLIKLADGSKGAKGAELAKEIAQQYADKPSTGKADGDDVSSKYDVVFNRIKFLENKVRDLQSNHDAMMADIRATTGGKIKELERVLAKTGVDGEALQRAAEAKRLQEEQRREKYGRIEGASTLPAGGQGGPFNPPATSVLKDKETELYFNLRKLTALNEIVTAMPLASPMASDDYRQTSGFGTRVDPFRGVLGYHAGVDLAGNSGAKIVAANDGRVDFAGWKTAYGNVVDVKHEYGFATRYGHLSKILVRPGQVVKKGQVIAIQGSTGRSTGEHLHYEVQYQGRPINPGNFLKAGADVRALD
jgi:murein DD-endopeptidase MepM/ murein hydrolase activator NlpD